MEVRAAAGAKREDCGEHEKRDERSRDDDAHGVSKGVASGVRTLKTVSFGKMGDPEAPKRFRQNSAAASVHGIPLRATGAMGQQSNSGKSRSKRDGIPNNPKIRKQLLKIASDKKEGMTYAKRKAMREAAGVKSKKENTEFGSKGMALKSAPKGPLEIRYRALAKKLRQCEELEVKKKEGATLDKWQLQKLRKKMFLKAEMKAMKKSMLGEGEEEEEESESESEESDDDNE